MDDVKQIHPSIPQIDSNLANIAGRLSKIRQEIRFSVFGETPMDQIEDPVEMPTPSLDSFDRRIKNIQEELTGIETLSVHLRK